MLLEHFTENAAQRDGDRPAIVFEGSTLTFAELDTRIKGLAGGLRALLPPGSRVAVLSDNRPEVTEAQFAIPSAGMTAVFLNQRLTGPELAYILENSGASAILVEERYLPVIAEIAEGVPALRHVVGFDGEGGVATAAYSSLVESAPLTGSAPEPADIAWLVYTSGTTGRPKGVMISHRNLSGTVANFLLGIRPDRHGRYLFPFPLSHVTAHAQPALFAAGVTLYLQRSFDPKAYMEAIAEYEITGSPIAPAMLGLILARPELAELDVTSMRKLFYGASSITPALLRRAMERFPNAEFTQGFGMTELAGNAVWMDHATHLRGIRGESDLLSACGRPAPLASVRIADERGMDLPFGDVGEILVRADQVMEGYWENPEATKSTLVDGWLHTGDVARFDKNGLLYIVDRKKDMIVTGGENVYSREVEDALAEHPGIADVAVVGVPDETWGENVCAVIVRATGSEITSEEVIAHARSKLASYKKPKRVEFVDQLPRNATGKLLKRDLRNQFTH